MKTLVLSFWMILTVMTTAFCQSQKTLIKSVDLQGATIVASALQGNVTVTEWDKEFIRITATIDVKNFDENILKKLVEVGRYDIQSSLQNGKLMLIMPAMERHVVIKGTDLIEHLTIEIAVPQGVKVELKNENATSSL